MQSHQYLYETHGLENITLPPNLTKLGKAAFDGNRLTEITVPKNVSEIGDYCFSDCCEMLEATVLGSVIGTCAFTYCTNLTTIYFDGTVAQWRAIRKGNNWAAKSGNDVGKLGLLKIECSNGYYQFNEESSEWEEVIE